MEAQQTSGQKVVKHWFKLLRKIKLFQYFSSAIKFNSFSPIGCIEDVEALVFEFDLLFQPNNGRRPITAERNHVIKMMQKEVLGVNFMKWMRGYRIAKYLKTEENLRNFFILGPIRHRV